MTRFDRIHARLTAAGFVLWGASGDGFEYHLTLPSGRVVKRLTVADGVCHTSRFHPTADHAKRIGHPPHDRA